MIIDFNEIAGNLVDYSALDQYLGLAISNPFLFLLVTVIMIDVITGVFASLKNGSFDSSIGFNGWIKHTCCILVCIITEFSSMAIGAPVIANAVCFFAMFFYVGSIPGNLTACGLKLPESIKKIFKKEIERKMKKWIDEE